MQPACRVQKTTQLWKLIGICLLTQVAIEKIGLATDSLEVCRHKILGGLQNIRILQIVLMLRVIIEAEWLAFHYNPKALGLLKKMLVWKDHDN